MEGWLCQVRLGWVLFGEFRNGRLWGVGGYSYALDRLTGRVGELVVGELVVRWTLLVSHFWIYKLFIH